MRVFIRQPGIKFLLFLLLAAPAVQAAPGQSAAAILPSAFNGWQEDPSSVKISTDATTADPADAAVLKEYGFSDAELASYTRDDRIMQVKAARFDSASGAFGAFSFYQQPRMQTEKIGDDAVSNNTRILFYRGNVLIDVALDRVTAMSAADLRALANTLPQQQGNLAVLPALLADLPRQNYIPHSDRYIRGPLATERLSVPIPAGLIDFGISPELVMGQYRSSWGEANLTLIDYHTPQIATQKLHAMQDANLPGGPLYFKRSGPWVVVVNGNIPQDEAQSLLAAINWDANVTMTQPTRPDARNNVAGLIVGVFFLIGFIVLAAVIFGFAFGGMRVLMRKLFPNKNFDRSDDAEIIRLNLK